MKYILNSTMTTESTHPLPTYAPTTTDDSAIVSYAAYTAIPLAIACMLTAMYASCHCHVSVVVGDMLEDDISL